jgi:hypothetical protein
MKAKVYSSEAEDLSAADGGVTRGRPLAGPILFVDPTTRAFVANRPATGKSCDEPPGVYVGTFKIEV